MAAFFLAVVIAMNQNFMAGLGAWSAGASLTMSAARLFKGGMPSGSSGSPLAAMGGGGNMLNAQGGGSRGSSGGGSGGGSLDGLQNGRATGASPTASNPSPGNASSSGSPSQATPSAQSSSPTSGGQSQSTHSPPGNSLNSDSQTRKPASGFQRKPPSPLGGPIGPLMRRQPVALPRGIRTLTLFKMPLPVPRQPLNEQAKRIL